MVVSTQRQQGSTEQGSGDPVEYMGHGEINGFARYEVNITSGIPQASGQEFSTGPVATPVIARRSLSFSEANSLATALAEAEYQTAVLSSTSEEFVSEQPPEEEEAAAAFGEGDVKTSSSVDVMEISTSEGEQADTIDGAGSPNQDCCCEKENHPHHEQVQVGVISFNAPMIIPPARKLSRRFGGTGDFHLRGSGQKRCLLARTTLPHTKMPHASQGSASPSLGLLDASSDSWSETFDADSDSDVDHDEDCGDDTDSYTDTDGSSGDAVRRTAGVMCMLRFRATGSSSARARPGGTDMPRRRHKKQHQQHRQHQQPENQKLKLNKKRQQEEGKRKKRRPQVRPQSRGPQDVRPPAAYKTSRGSRYTCVGGGDTDGALVAQASAEVVAASPAEDVWKSLSAPHQRLVDTWPCQEPSGGERQPGRARRVEAGSAPSHELLPGPTRGAGSPPSPQVVVIHTSLIDHERCPLGQYTRGLSYLLQTLGAGKSSWRRPSRLRGSPSATYPDAGKGEACAEAIVLIDARGDTVGAKVKKLLNILIRGGAGGEMPLCDPALSLWPVRIRKILIANASTVLKAMLMTRAVALNSVMSSPLVTSPPPVTSSPGGEAEDGASESESNSENESESEQVEIRWESGGSRIVCGATSASCRRRGGSASPSRSFLALSGWSSRKWLRYEVGEDVAGCLPLELGGDLDLRTWSWEGWVGRRMQREDMMTEVKLGPLDDALAPAAWRFLDACHALAESQCIEDYARVLSDALKGGLSVPVTWVKRTLCDVVQARQAHEPPWRDTIGGSSTRSVDGVGGGGSGAASAGRRGLNREWTQLWKDMGRDVVEIRGERIDPLGDGQGVEGDVRGGAAGGGGGGGAGDPDVVLAPLAMEIARVGAEGGLMEMPEVECFLAARDILLSTKRTSSGGDVWVCVDRLCGRRDMVVVCPASHEADPLRVAVEFEREPETPLQGPDQEVVLDRDRRSSTTDPPSPPVSPFPGDYNTSDSSNPSFPHHHQRHKQLRHKQQHQQQQEASTSGQGRRAASRPSALLTSPLSLPRCNCGAWLGCPVLDAASEASAGAGVGGRGGGTSGLARGIVSHPRQKSNPASSVDACCASLTSCMESDSCHGGGMSALGCRVSAEETSRSCFWPDESDRDAQRDDYSDEQVGKKGGRLDPPRSPPERATSRGHGACPQAQTPLPTASTIPKPQEETEAEIFRPAFSSAFENARRPPTPAALRRCRPIPKALLGGGRSPYGALSRDDSFGPRGLFRPSPKAEHGGWRSPCGALSRDDSFGPRGLFRPSPKAEHGGWRSPCGALSRDDSFGPRGPFFPSPKAELGGRGSSRAALVRDGLFRSRSPSHPSPKAELSGRRSPCGALSRDDSFGPRGPFFPSPKAEINGRVSSSAALVRDGLFRSRSPSRRPSPKGNLGGQVSSRVALVRDDLLRSKSPSRSSPKAELGSRGSLNGALARDDSVCSRGSWSGTNGRVGGDGSSSRKVEDDARPPEAAEVEREPAASSGAGGGGFFWGFEACGSPGRIRHASFPADLIDARDCDTSEGGGGCVRVTVTTTMSYRICDANPMNEDDAVIRIVKGVFERIFRVRADGALEDLQPTDGNPVVRMVVEK